MTVNLKLKQAAAVLGVSAKELQNLVQLKVIRPPRRQNLCWFDGRLLLEAKVALYLKESLGTSSQLLSLFTDALSRGIGGEDTKKRRFVLLRSLPPRGQEPVEVRIPLGSLAREIENQLPQAIALKDRPRGRRRTGWRTEMNATLTEAATQMGEAPSDAIPAVIRDHRRRRRVLLEVTATVIPMLMPTSLPRRHWNDGNNMDAMPGRKQAKPDQTIPKPDRANFRVINGLP